MYSSKILILLGKLLKNPLRSQAVTRSLTTEENLTAIIEVDDEITRRKTSTQVVSPGLIIRFDDFKIITKF